MNPTDEEIIKVSFNSNSARESARILGLSYSTYIRYAKKLGCYNTNQGLKGTSKRLTKKSIPKWHYYFNTLSNKSAYWMGFIAADGSVHKNRGLVRIALKMSDRRHLELMKKDIECTSEVNDYYVKLKGKRFRASGLNLYSDKIKETLKIYGIVPDKSHKNIDFLKNIPKEFKIPFILGYFDGDGSISITKNGRTITFTGNENLIKRIKEELGKCGVCDGKIHKASDYASVLYYCNKINVKIFCEIYCSYEKKIMLLDRKLKIAKKGI